MKKENLPISVIMPVYNGEKFVSRAIKSILNQTFRNFEFIIIDDGSRDKTLKILKEFSKKDKRIKVLVNKNNKGIVKSLNKGLKIAKGNYIARMDSDDFSFPKRFELQHKFLEKHKDIYLLGTEAINRILNGNRVYRRRVLKTSKKIEKALFNYCPFTHSSIMFRNTQEYLYREKMLFIEDYDFYTLMLTDGKKFANLSKPLVEYSLNENSITFLNREKHMFMAEIVKKFLIQRIRFGNDEYTLLDVDILKISKRFRKKFLKEEIYRSFLFGDYELSRRLIQKFTKKYGFNFYKDLSIYIRFIISFLPSFLIKKIMYSLEFIQDLI